MLLREVYQTALTLTLHRPVGLPGQVRLGLTNNTIIARFYWLAQNVRWKNRLCTQNVCISDHLFSNIEKLKKKKKSSRKRLPGCCIPFSLNWTGLCKCQKKKEREKREIERKREKKLAQKHTRNANNNFQHLNNNRLHVVQLPNSFFFFSPPLKDGTTASMDMECKSLHILASKKRKPKKTNTVKLFFCFFVFFAS